MMRTCTGFDRPFRHVALAAVFVCVTTSLAFAQSNCPNADPNDNSPDDAALNACLSGGGTVTIVHGSPGYILANPLYITQSGTSLVGDSALANFVARSDISGRMLEANDVSNVTLANLWFDGNKASRSGCDTSTGLGKNLMIIGDNFTMDNVGSVNALCGSGAEVKGTGIQITNSFFASNGSPAPNGPWSDGLTVWGCINGTIHDNDFQDNTDVDFIVGGSSGCSFYNNHVAHYGAHGFAGIMVAMFPGLDGNHANSSYHDNTVTSDYDLLAFGVMVGQHPWTLDPSMQVSNAGSVYSNSSGGAVVNVAVDGTTDGYVASNSASGAQGSWGFACSHSANYTAGHFGGTVEGGYESFVFDAGNCRVP